jgi:type II secretory pathway component GspD/PulD (secretin)
MAAFVVVALLSFSFSGFAQTQPPEAVNNQDEVVNISSPPADKDGVLTIFRSGDKQQISRYISQVIELKGAEGYEIVPHVLKAVKLEGGTARTLKYKDPSAGKTRYFVQVITTERQMPSILQTIKSLDLPGMTSSEGDLKYAVRMRHRRASEVARIMENTSVSGEGDIYADDISNTLWFKDSVSDGLRNIAYVGFYDVPPPQVEFDIKVVELSESNIRKLGLDWDAWKRNISGEFNIGMTWLEGGFFDSNMDSLLTLDAAFLADFLNYTSRSGSSKVTQRARLTASNEKPAILSEAKPVANVDLKKAGESVAPASEGLFVAITPTIGTDLVTAQIEMTVKTLEDYDKLAQPQISTRDIKTMVTLEDQKPFLIGTAERESKGEYRNGIPGLKSIPILKYLFSVEVVRKSKSRVFVIATPSLKNQITYASRTIQGDKYEVDPALLRNAIEVPADAIVK